MATADAEVAGGGAAAAFGKADAGGATGDGVVGEGLPAAAQFELLLRECKLQNQMRHRKAVAEHLVSNYPSPERGCGGRGWQCNPSPRAKKNGCFSVL